MPSHRDEKMAGLIKQKAAEFLSSTAAKATLVTVTRVDVSARGQYATVYITAYPDDDLERVVRHANKKRGDLKQFLQKETKLGRIPYLTIEIDEGEKRRQRLDQLSQEM